MAYALLFNPITIHFARKEKAALLEEFNPQRTQNISHFAEHRLFGAKKNLSHRMNGRGKSGTPSGARTLDTLIKSQVLYQLS